MSSGAIDIRIDTDGRVQARRKDGKPLTVEDRMEALALVIDQETKARAWVIDEVRDQAGSLRAVLICSALVEDHLWLIIDEAFTPPDDRARYYADELSALGTKTNEQLRAIHCVKVAFRGGRVIQ